MSPLKLGMVGLGIVVLLAGVWAVSVQSGNEEEGTRVEVGTWSEGTEVITSEVVGVETIGVTGTSGVEPPTVVLTGSLDSRRGSGRRTGGLLLSTDDLSRERGESVSPLRNTIVGSPLGSPSAHGAPTPFPMVRSPTTGRHADMGHGREPSGSGRHRRKWSTFFEGQGGAGGVAAGLSIGLGAASPGFALVPRRRVSSGVNGSGSGGGSGGLASPGVTRTSTSVGVVESGRGRRTVSEGDFGRLRDGEGRPLIGAVGEPGSGSGGNSRSGQGGEDAPKGGWGWVRKVFKL
jgi:hypothetical protein